MDASILSVGVDIGTSTTSMVVSRLSLKNTASCFSVPHISITEKEIIFQSEIYETPLISGSLIDVDAVAEILKKEYRKAGITPEMIETGAVIITGESARKENAVQATKILSEFAGDFVVATAGPDLESIIAAKGAGAPQYSDQHSCTVINFDVGGGTTNIAAFHCGVLKAKGCLDVGGRLVRIDNNGIVTYISPRVSLVAESMGIYLKTGDTAQKEVLQRVTGRMAGLLCETAGVLPESPLCQTMRTSGSSPLNSVGKIDCVSFSGGVADYIYHPDSDWLRYGDIGLLLADSIRQSGLYQNYRIIPAKETIRATVVGAGSYTTTLSGSTITYSDESVFPVKNLPAFVLGMETEKNCLNGDESLLAEQTDWFLRQNNSENMLFCFKYTKNPAYRQVCNIADVLVRVAGAKLPGRRPVFVLTEHDFAKSLGQALKRRLGTGREVICIDSISAEPGDYIDLGRPVMNGMAVPAVVKTLVYG